MAANPRDPWLQQAILDTQEIADLIERLADLKASRVRNIVHALKAGVDAKTIAHQIGLTENAIHTIRRRNT